VLERVKGRIQLSLATGKEGKKNEHYYQNLLGARTSRVIVLMKGKKGEGDVAFPFLNSVASGKVRRGGEGDARGWLAYRERRGSASDYYLWAVI